VLHVYPANTLTWHWDVLPVQQTAQLAPVHQCALSVSLIIKKRMQERALYARTNILTQNWDAPVQRTAQPAQARRTVRDVSPIIKKQVRESASCAPRMITSIQTWVVCNVREAAQRVLHQQSVYLATLDTTITQ
jgi:hypothetical protein